MRPARTHGSRRTAGARGQHRLGGGRSMQHTAHIGSAGNGVITSESDCAQRLRRHVALRNVSVVLAVTAAFVFFLADILVPRGVTAAIGYALVPALAGGSGR